MIGKYYNREINEFDLFYIALYSNSVSYCELLVKHSIINVKKILGNLSNVY